jgi:hypothetical protein
MSATVPFKQLILRAVLRDVSPMVARLISVSDDTELSDLHDVFQQVLKSVKKSGVKRPEREIVGTNHGRRPRDRC